ncbi:hypothetical protein FKM82_010906 [Ascaphus truei]
MFDTRFPQQMQVNILMTITMGENASLWESLVIGHPVCTNWKQEAEGSIYHLASVLFVLGCMGGSGFFGLLYVYIFFALSFLWSCIWAWLDVCAADVFSWNFILLVICIMQIIHVAYQLRRVTFDTEFQEAYSKVFQPLGISLTVFRKIISSCNAEVVTLEREHCYAMQGKTPIDKLSLLVSGRIRVTVDGEFLHYIFPLQFLDSPEWDSMRPSEEGIFQVFSNESNRDSKENLAVNGNLEQETIAILSNIFFCFSIFWTIWSLLYRGWCYHSLGRGCKSVI